MATVKMLAEDRRGLVICLVMGFLFGACAPNLESGDAVNMQIPLLKTEDHFQVFVETPAGNHNAIVYDYKAQRFDTIGDGFQSNLPYPVNYGFFPVLSDTLLKVPVWIFSKRLEVGDTLPVNLLGVIDYTDGGIIKRELVVIPVDPQLQTVKSKEFEDFIIENDPLKFVFEYWIKNRHGLGQVSRIKWDDKESALATLNKWLGYSDNR